MGKRKKNNTRMGSLCLSFEKDTHLRYNKIIKMKWLLALISIAVTLFVITQGKSLESASVPPDAECLLCVDDIMAAIDHCTNATTPNPTMECIEYALGAASDCIRCVCDIIDIIDGGDGTLCN